jgi:uncharacterized protein YggT (Ycf19 family)
VGGFLAGVLLLADVRTSVARFVEVFVYVYILCILAYVLTTWLQLPYSSALGAVQRFLHDVCDPYLRLFRRVLPPIGPFDLSPVVAIFVLIVIQRLVARFL